MVKSKLKALQHFKVDPVLKIDETFYKQAESLKLIIAKKNFFFLFLRPTKLLLQLTNRPFTSKKSIQRELND